MLKIIRAYDSKFGEPLSVTVRIICNSLPTSSGKMKLALSLEVELSIDTLDLHCPHQNIPTIYMSIHSHQDPVVPSSTQNNFTARRHFPVQSALQHLPQAYDWSDCNH